MFQVRIIGNYVKTMELTPCKEYYVHLCYNNEGEIVWKNVFKKVN